MHIRNMSYLKFGFHSIQYSSMKNVNLILHLMCTCIYHLNNASFVQVIHLNYVNNY